MFKRFLNAVNDQRAGRLLLFPSFVVVVFLLVGVCGSLFFRWNFASMIVQQSNMIVIWMCIMFGGQFFSEYTRRTGTTLHCAKCEYQKAPEGETALRCPECGSDWTLPRGIVRGRREGRPWMIGVGVASCVIGVGAMLTSLVPAWSRTRGLATRLLPTSTLIEAIVVEGGFDYAEWAELGTRTLTPQQVLRLAEGLLDKRLQKEFFSVGDETWFVSQLRKNALPQRVVERYYREMARVWVVAPQSAKLNSSIRVSVGCERHYNLHGRTSRAGQEMMYVSGFFAGDANAPIGRLEKSNYLGLMDDAKYRPVADVCAERAGPLRIRFVAWLVVEPRTAMNRIVIWQDDGTPVISDGVEWAERIEAECTVQVVE